VLRSDLVFNRTIAYRDKKVVGVFVHVFSFTDTMQQSSESAVPKRWAAVKTQKGLTHVDPPDTMQQKSMNPAAHCILGSGQDAKRRMSLLIHMQCSRNQVNQRPQIIMGGSHSRTKRTSRTSDPRRYNAAEIKTGSP
jgi:hypothetical protein